MFRRRAEWQHDSAEDTPAKLEDLGTHGLSGGPLRQFKVESWWTTLRTAILTQDSGKRASAEVVETLRW
jgi:hypothetical protein